VAGEDRWDADPLGDLARDHAERNGGWLAG
jgi:hypothetical protein